MHYQKWENEWTRTHEAMKANIDEKQILIDRLIVDNRELLDACIAARITIERICRLRNPIANFGTGLATPDEQVTLEILSAVIQKENG
jgi:hypothetical protein